MSNPFEIAIDDQVDLKAQERRERLMPGGIPRYIRVWDNLDEYPHDGITVVFTKKTIVPGVFMFLSMNGSGGWSHGETDTPNGSKEWGKRIKFEDLSEGCKRTVIGDYEELWDL
jgi:hypothetical protein